MKILAFLQNQWFKNPEKVKALFDRLPDKRNEIIKRLLFAGCLTGRRLRDTFGDLCDKITWEEASHNIADRSSGVFVADIEHIKNSIDIHKPDIIICFGKIAGDALSRLGVSVHLLYAPHPAARGNTVSVLKIVAKRVRELIQ